MVVNRVNYHTRTNERRQGMAEKALKFSRNVNLCSRIELLIER